jgi:valyl-tRNA synthetase
MIENRYQPSAVEGRIYEAWEKAGAFRAGRPERAKAEPYCLVIPPPNVTGSLHMGHALNNTLQDILCRFERMRGRDVLWQPGTDHAGIATQAVVERQLVERQEPNSRAMGRDAFIKRVWDWKAESGGTIISQLKRLGASCDWSRERFTMDEGLSRAVMKVFVALYREGLIYKDKRLVNWDPKLKTAISDLEVQQVETKGHLWFIKYPIERSDEFIIVATTRPETMLGDVAVAVHPENAKLKHLIGKYAILPLVGRRIPVIADEYADPEKGSGAVKITPAHDFNDFEVWQRHKDQELKDIEPPNVFDVEASVKLQGNLPFLVHVRGAGDTEETIELANWTAPEIDNLDRFVARKKIVARLEERGLIEKIESTVHTVPHGDRSGAVLEPFLTNQWYVRAKTLVQSAIAAVREQKTVFVPAQWEATFFNWMENIQPWCISRQIWWGHQIPAWYGRKEVAHREWSSIFDDPEIFVAGTEAEAIELARQKYGCEIHLLSTPPHDDLDPIFQQIINDEISGKPRWEPIWRDPDVLDTWFSSALWPFSTLGWPDETPELKRFYPTSVLVTGFDIIFFWVARMMMMGLHFMRDVPFHDVYIHRLVRDASGAKMSKSKGNVVDPLGVIDQYGADALRFTLARGAAQGHDIRLGSQEVENNRNFATKLWNAARFAEMNECFIVSEFDPASVKEPINQWIISQLGDTLGKIELALDDYRFNDAANAIYHFVWDFYCDWYLELTKPIFVTPQPNDAAKGETRATVAYVRDQILKVLHPFMPFITEELWGVSERNRKEPMLALALWPTRQPHFADAHEEVGWLIDLVTAIRSVRTELNLSGLKFPIVIQTSLETFPRVERWREAILRLARLSDMFAIGFVPQNLWQRVQRFFYSAWWRPNDFWKWQTVNIPSVRGAVQIIVRGETVFLPLAGVIDLAAERARLAKEMAKCDADIARVDAKLGNANFVARAPEEVVEEEKEKREEAEMRKAKIAEALERLKGAA